MAHTQPKRNSTVKQNIQNFVYKFFSAIRLNNSTEKEFLLTQEIDPSKLHIIPLVVSQDVFKLTNHNPETRKNLVYFGNITAKKDVLTIIKAFEKVKKLRHEVQLNIIGNMWDKQVVEYAQKSAFSLDIIFHGFLDNDAVVQKLNENMLYINSSLDEGQCVAVYDAALCGLGLCLPNIMSFVDVYKDKALFHNVGDDTSLSQNILYYLDNPDIIQHHNQKNIEMIKKEYSIEAVEGKLKLLLSKFI